MHTKSRCTSPFLLCFFQSSHGFAVNFDGSHCDEVLLTLAASTRKRRNPHRLSSPQPATQREARVGLNSSRPMSWHEIRRLLSHLTWRMCPLKTCWAYVEELCRCHSFLAVTELHRGGRHMVRQVLAGNSGSFQVGDRLQGTVQVQVLEIHGNYIIDFQGQTLSPMVPWVMLVMSLSNP